MEMEMEMEMESYLKDNNVGVGVVVGGVETPTDTANHELAAQALLKLRIAALFFKAAYQFMEAKGSWEMNGINPTEEAIATKYYCHGCRDVVTADVEMTCPLCQSGCIQACEGVASLYLAMPSESELSESSSDGESTMAVSEWILLLTSLGIEILSAVFDQVSSPRKPHYALIGMMLAIVAVLVCISELVHNGIKERVVLRRRGMLWCFYYPPPNNMLFGTFPEITGLSLAIAQCICSAVQYHFIRRHATNPMKLSLLPVSFVFGLVVSKLVQNQRFSVDDTLQDGT